MAGPSSMLWLASARFEDVCSRRRLLHLLELIVLNFVEPCGAIAGVIALALIEKLDIADGVSHSHFLNHRGESAAS